MVAWNVDSFCSPSYVAHFEILLRNTHQNSLRSQSQELVCPDFYDDFVLLSRTLLLIKPDLAGIIHTNFESFVFGQRAHPALNRIIRSAFPPDDRLCLIPLGIENHCNWIAYSCRLRDAFKFVTALPIHRNSPGNPHDGYQEN